MGYENVMNDMVRLVLSMRGQHVRNLISHLVVTS
jgi:hypothetical protein